MYMRTYHLCFVSEVVLTAACCRTWERSDQVRTLQRERKGKERSDAVRVPEQRSCGVDERVAKQLAKVCQLC